MYRLLFEMYICGMSNISVTDARGRLPELIARARSEAVFVERRGKVEAVLISPERYARLMDALDDADDAAAFDEAMAEEGDNVPWAQVKADLGWE
jgi:antitoxin Phd